MSKSGDEDDVFLKKMDSLVGERTKSGIHRRSHMCESYDLQRFHIVNQGANIRIYYACAGPMFIEPIDVRNMLSLRYPYIQRHPKTFSNVCFSVNRVTVTLSTGGQGKPYVRVNLAGRIGVERFCSVSWQVARMIEEVFSGRLWVTHIAHEIGNNVIVINPSKKNLSVEKIIHVMDSDAWKYEPDVFPGMNMPGNTFMGGEESTTKKVIAFTSNMLNCLGNRDLRSFKRDLPGILRGFDHAEVPRVTSTPRENNRRRRDDFEKYKISGADGLPGGPG